MSTYNAGERKDVRKAEKVQATLAAFAAETVRGLMSTTSGRSWMYGRLESAHIFASTFDRDPGLMAFNEGQRTQGLQLLTDIMLYCPEQYVIMTREANERHASGERSRSTNGDRRDQGRGSDTAGDDDRPEAGLDTGTGAEA